MNGRFYLYILLAIFTLLFITSFFLVCILILRFFKQLSEKRQNKFISKWQIKIFEYISSESKPASLISLIPKSHYNNLIIYLRTFLFNLKGSDLERLKELFTEPRLSSYFIKNLKSRKRKKRVRAIYFLRFAKTTEVIDLLDKELDSPNELIFRTAVESLAYLNANEKINRILDLAAKRKDLNADSILSMINKFDKAICPTLTKRLEVEKSNKILHVMIAILWHHKYAEANKEVLQILIYTADKNVTLEAIRYLGEVEDVSSLNSLRLGLNSSRPDVRVSAIQSISKIGDVSLEDNIIEKFNDPQLEVKMAAARAMYKFSSKGKAKLYELSNLTSNRVEVVIAKRIFIERRIFGNV